MVGILVHRPKKRVKYNQVSIKLGLESYASPSPCPSLSLIANSRLASWESIWSYNLLWT